jgi:hypothetical protein
VPEASVLKLNTGERIRLDASGFGGLAKAFLADIERKFCYHRLPAPLARA